MRLFGLSLFALAFAVAPPACAQKVVLDGESKLPARESVAYTFQCDDSTSVRLSITQLRHGYPRVTQLISSKHGLPSASRQAVDDALRSFRKVESVSPRCLTSGGVQMLLGGLGRSDVPSRRVVVAVKIDSTGRLSIEP